MSATSTSMPWSPAGDMSPRRLLGAYLAEARSEIRRYLRTPTFMLPLLLFPGVFYLMFGVLMNFSPDGSAARYLLASYGAFGIMGTGLFGFGVSLAVERDGGLLTLKRALPVPAGAYLLGKMVMAMLIAALVVAELLLLGIFFGHVALSALQMLAMLACSVLGVLPFCALGMFVGTLLKGQGAPGLLNLVYLPMAFLSGLWIPLQIMPKIVSQLAPIFPSYHLNQIMQCAVGSTSNSIVIPVLVLLGCGAVFLWLATWRLRRNG